MTNKFKKRVRAFAEAHSMTYQAALQAIQNQEVILLVTSNVIFETEDPVSPSWRAAWGRFVTGLLDPLQSEIEEKIIREVHHRGWRAGVHSVRQDGPPPGCPRHYAARERHSWEHGAVAGRQAAKDHLETYGKDPKELR